jgi:hypothetical protein
MTLQLLRLLLVRDRVDEHRVGIADFGEHAPDGGVRQGPVVRHAAVILVVKVRPDLPERLKRRLAGVRVRSRLAALLHGISAQTGQKSAGHHHDDQ